MDGFGGRPASAEAAMRTFRASCNMKEGAGCAFAADLLMQVGSMTSVDLLCRCFHDHGENVGG